MQHELSLSEQLAYSTIRIECDTALGGSTGTGFYYRFCQKGDSFVPAIVTNRHVVAGATTGRFHIHLAGTGGSTFPLAHKRFEVADFARLGSDIPILRSIYALP